MNPDRDPIRPFAGVENGESNERMVDAMARAYQAGKAASGANLAGLRSVGMIVILISVAFCAIGFGVEVGIRLAERLL